MKKEKYSMKEELKEELRSTTQNVKPEDLDMDETVDDKYTSSVFEKFKNGQTKNGWFTWSGILSMVFGVLCIVSMVILGIVFAVQSDSLLAQVAHGYDYDGTRTKVIVCIIVFTIVGIIGFFVGLKIKSYANYTKEQLIESLGAVIGMSVLQFFFGGLIFVVLTLVGYFVGIGSDYGAIYYNRIDNSSSQKRRLAEAKKMYEDGIISYAEYQSLRQNILRDVDFD